MTRKSCSKNQTNKPLSKRACRRAKSRVCDPRSRVLESSKDLSSSVILLSHAAGDRRADPLHSDTRGRPRAPPVRKMVFAMTPVSPPRLRARRGPSARFRIRRGGRRRGPRSAQRRTRDRFGAGLGTSAPRGLALRSPRGALVAAFAKKGKKAAPEPVYEDDEDDEDDEEVGYDDDDEDEEAEIGTSAADGEGGGWRGGGRGDRRRLGAHATQVHRHDRV